MKRIIPLLIIITCFKGHGQELLKDIHPGLVDSGATPFTECNGVLLFTAMDEYLVDNENELWRTDGTAEGTYKVIDLNPDKGAIPANFADLKKVGNYVYFKADDGIHGLELWKSDGTVEGTAMVKDIRPGTIGVGPNHLVVFNNLLYFSAEDGIHGRELWKSDGTEEGTVMIKDIRPGEYGSISSSSFESTLTVMGDYFYFSASDGSPADNELWKSDGTEEGTIMVKDLDVDWGNGVYPKNLIAYGDKLIFWGSTNSTGYEIYVSDGTEAGTMLLKDINPGPAHSAPTQFTLSNGLLFFRATTPETDFELWATNGTTEGTYMVKDVMPGPESGVGAAYNNMADFNNELYFFGSDGLHGNEVWKSDGTEEGTYMLEDTLDDVFGTSPRYFAVAGGMLYFAGSSTGTDLEFWKSDGTASGTQLVMDMSPGNQTSDPQDFYFYNEAVYFRARTPSYGWEIWKYSVSTSGIEELTKDTIAIYPNPFNDSVQLDGHFANGSSYTIFDITGKIVKEGILLQDNKIDTTGLSSGNYLLMIDSIEKTIKIIKR